MYGSEFGKNIAKLKAFGLVYKSTKKLEVTG